MPTTQPWHAPLRGLIAPLVAILALPAGAVLLWSRGVQSALPGLIWQLATVLGILAVCLLPRFRARPSVPAGLFGVAVWAGSVPAIARFHQEPGLVGILGWLAAGLSISALAASIAEQVAVMRESSLPGNRARLLALVLVVPSCVSVTYIPGTEPLAPLVEMGRAGLGPVDGALAPAEWALRSGVRTHDGAVLARDPHGVLAYQTTPRVGWGIGLGAPFAALVLALAWRVRRRHARIARSPAARVTSPGLAAMADGTLAIVPTDLTMGTALVALRTEDVRADYRSDARVAIQEHLPGEKSALLADLTRRTRTLELAAVAGVAVFACVALGPAMASTGHSPLDSHSEPARTVAPVVEREWETESEVERERESEAEPELESEREWTRTRPMPAARNQVLSVAYAGHLYMIGGTDERGVTRDDIFIGTIGPSGDIVEWVTSPSPFPTPIAMASLVAHNGYLYTLGGETGTRQLDEVWMTVIASDGSLGAWSRTTSFTGIRGGALGAALNGYLYVIGGRYDPSGGPRYCSAYTDVQFARQNADGTLGSWQATAGPATPRWWSYNIAVDRGRIYLMGGYTGCGGYSDEVVFAAPAADGTIRSWTQTRSMARAGAAFSVAHDGSIYTIGGDPGGHPSGRLDVARIAEDGTLGEWRRDAPIPSPFTGSTAGAAYGPFLYQIGTTGGGSASTDVLVMRVEQPSI